MAKLIKIWITDDQFKQLTAGSELNADEIASLLVMRKLGVEFTKKTRREVLARLEEDTRRENERLPKKLMIRVEGLLRANGPMTTRDISSRLKVTPTGVNKAIRGSKLIVKVAERKVSNGPGRPSAVWGIYR